MKEKNKATPVRPCDLIKKRAAPHSFRHSGDLLTLPVRSLLHEITLTSASAAVQEAPGGRPRAALHTASDPWEYLDHKDLKILTAGDLPRLPPTFASAL